MASVYFNPAVGGDGSTVTDDSNATTGLANGGHRTRFVPALAQTVAVAANTVTKATEAAASATSAAAAAATAVNSPGTQATSTTSITVGLGSVSLTLAQTGKAFVVGMYVLVAQTSAPTNFMLGAITAYNSGTGAMTINVVALGGTATATDWTISVCTPAATVTLNTKLISPIERISISASAPAATEQFDFVTQSVKYFTANTANNWTLNVRGNSTTTLNSIMAIGDSITIAALMTNSGTAYYQSALTVDGSAVTPKWQGGTAPTGGNASAVDLYSLTIVKTANATFSAFVGQTKFA